MVNNHRADGDGLLEAETARVLIDGREQISAIHSHITAATLIPLTHTTVHDPARFALCQRWTSPMLLGCLRSWTHQRPRHPHLHQNFDSASSLARRSPPQSPNLLSTAGLSRSMEASSSPRRSFRIDQDDKRFGHGYPDADVETERITRTKREYNYHHQPRDELVYRRVLSHFKFDTIQLDRITGLSRTETSVFLSDGVFSYNFPSDSSSSGPCSKGVIHARNDGLELRTHKAPVPSYVDIDLSPRRPLPPTQAQVSPALRLSPSFPPLLVRESKYAGRVVEYLEAAVDCEALRGVLERTWRLVTVGGTMGWGLRNDRLHVSCTRLESAALLRLLMVSRPAVALISLVQIRTMEREVPMCRRWNMMRAMRHSVKDCTAIRVPHRAFSDMRLAFDKADGLLAEWPHLGQARAVWERGNKAIAMVVGGRRNRVLNEVRRWRAARHRIRASLPSRASAPSFVSSPHVSPGPASASAVPRPDVRHSRFGRMHLSFGYVVFHGGSYLTAAAVSTSLPLMHSRILPSLLAQRQQTQTSLERLSALFLSSGVFEPMSCALILFCTAGSRPEVSGPTCLPLHPTLSFLRPPLPLHHIHVTPANGESFAEDEAVISRSLGASAFCSDKEGAGGGAVSVGDARGAVEEKAEDTDKDSENGGGGIVPPIVIKHCSLLPACNVRSQLTGRDRIVGMVVEISSFGSGVKGGRGKYILFFATSGEANIPSPTMAVSSQFYDASTQQGPACWVKAGGGGGSQGDQGGGIVGGGGILDYIMYSNDILAVRLKYVSDFFPRNFVYFDGVCGRRAADVLQSCCRRAAARPENTAFWSAFCGARNHSLRGRFLSAKSDPVSIVFWITFGTPVLIVYCDAESDPEYNSFAYRSNLDVGRLGDQGCRYGRFIRDTRDTGRIYAECLGGPQETLPG
ncbi:hypothetical protein R3P38DRAFT_2813910 [Favolaschia claudopus]|uniref:Uncharacterized protein n=1 Tax=Favolaschia claudopus TaxID=2862362 RepID=A0AAV9Z4I5_9AGAR